MNLTKWNPGKDLMDLQNELNKTFGDFFSKRPTDLSTDWHPSVDIIEHADSFIIKAELPGMNQKDIKISLTNDVLTIKGERHQEKEEEGKNFHRIERSYGSFHRTFTLPLKVKSETVKAVYKDGILEVNLPKAEETKPKEIDIEIK